MPSPHIARRPVHRVVSQPTVAKTMDRGMDQLVNAIRPTLGPYPRAVAVAPILGSKPPEILDDGGLIARRILELPDRDEDVGAMLLREALWQLHEKVGDGVATAAVICQSVYREGRHYLAQGGSAMRLREQLDAGLHVVLDHLSAAATMLDDQPRLTRIAASICSDSNLAELLSEIFIVVGPYGRLEIRGGRQRAPRHEYVRGIYWNEGLLARELLPNRGNEARVVLEDAAILITNLELNDPSTLLPVLRQCLDASQPRLMIVANRISDSVTALFLANQDPARLQIIAVKTPRALMPDRAEVLQEMALLLGGRPLLREAGDTLASATPAHFGSAQRAWANQTFFGVAGPGGDPDALQDRVEKLTRAYRESYKLDRRRELLQRLGTLQEGAATLWVGGASEPEIETRKEVAARAATTLRGALAEGVVPGGGVALLPCCHDLRAWADEPLPYRDERSCDEARQAAYRILAQALQMPARVLLENAGFDPNAILPKLRNSHSTCGFDVTTARYADMVEAGIVDVVSVVKAAVHCAVSTAALALTIDTVVHPKKRKGPLPNLTATT